MNSRNSLRVKKSVRRFYYKTLSINSKNVLDNLCSESDENKFDIKLAEQSTSDGLNKLRANYNSLEKSIKSILNKVSCLLILLFKSFC